jgi:hypothetical protein
MAHTIRLPSPFVKNPDALEIRGIPSNEVDKSPLAGRIAYAFVCLIALAIVSGCFS